MDYFRKFLTYLRKQYNTKGKGFFFVWGSILLVTTLSGILIDVFLPFGSGWNLVRTVVLIPLSVSLFAVGYGIGLFLHYMKRTDPNWTPYRLRFSPMWRMRISAIVGAAAFLLVYASNESWFFTLFSSSVLSVGFALIAFMRQTTEERKREKLGIPDARDVNYDSEVKKLQQKRKVLMEEKASKREAKKTQNGRKPFRAFRPLVPESKEDQV